VKTNLKVEVVLPSGVSLSMDDLSHIAGRVEETDLGWVLKAGEYRLPLDLEIRVGEAGIRLTMWF